MSHKILRGERPDHVSRNISSLTRQFTCSRIDPKVTDAGGALIETIDARLDAYGGCTMCGIDVFITFEPDISKSDMLIIELGEIALNVPRPYVWIDAEPCIIQMGTGKWCGDIQEITAFSSLGTSIANLVKNERDEMFIYVFGVPDFAQVLWVNIGYNRRDTEEAI